MTTYYPLLPATAEHHLRLPTTTYDYLLQPPTSTDYCMFITDYDLLRFTIIYGDDYYYDDDYYDY